MFSSNSPAEVEQLPQNALQIKQDDQFLSRLMSKETSMANPSFRVYYGAVSVAVPFMWESQPGTPKYTFCETTLPPLPPPPSYYSNSNKNPIKKQSSKSNLLHMLFPRIKKTNVSRLSPTSPSSSTLSPTPSLASWASFNSPSLLTATKNRERSMSSSLGSSFDSSAYDEKDDIESPTSTLCSTLCFRSYLGTA